MARIFVLSCCLVFSLVGNAFARSADGNCSDDLFSIAGQYLKLKNFKDKKSGGVVVSAVCRPWPHNTRLTLSAFAYDNGIEHEKTLLVAVIDNGTKRVVSSARSVIGEDAVTEVGESSLRLDTARYQLSKEVTAFGLRFQSLAPGASCGETNWGDELTLFVPEGKELRAVLNLSMYRQRSIEGCLSASLPRAVWEDAFLTIGIEKTSTNSYADLSVTARVVGSGNDYSADDLVKKTKNRTERQILRYDGKYYQTDMKRPWWLEP